MNTPELKRRIREKGITSKELASALGIEKETLYRKFEFGDSRFSVENIKIIRGLLDLTNFELIKIFFDE